MKKRLILWGILSSIFLASYVGIGFQFNEPAVATTWTVDDDAPADFHTIQEAINANETLTGHTISVKKGTYYENVVVNKTVSLVGEDSHKTIIDGNYTGPVLTIMANYVNVTGFTVRNSGGNPSCGIYIGSWSRGNNVSYNTITRNYQGILLFHTSENRIAGNSVTNNHEGFTLFESSNNVLRDNRIADNDYNFKVWSFSLSDFVNDIDASNTVDGHPIYFWINRQGMTVPRDAGYVALVNCGRITVRNLNLTRNEQGILLAFTTSSSIICNTITSNRYGIWLLKSSNNKIRENTVAHNNNGIRGWYSASNRIYHNSFVDNAGQVYIEYSANIWDNGCEGNYWSNYPGDFDEQGIGTSPFIVNEPSHDIDPYPLMNPFIEGDVNHDGRVNIRDIAQIAHAFDTRPEDRFWNPHCDLDENEAINIIDIAKAAANHGETARAPAILIPAS